MLRQVSLRVGQDTFFNSCQEVLKYEGRVRMVTRGWIEVGTGWSMANQYSILKNPRGGISVDTIQNGMRGVKQRLPACIFQAQSITNIVDQQVENQPPDQNSNPHKPGHGIH